eukprot:TRINITY_DN57079_c0_g1_i1.p1 TRINITY_DN57079_c0_g1~~TRINITY_DN57079_c0_g1_i1.p1  ORF type:complete len:278 (-),score=11.97 TRINITY_DN57079_c0_g1_i1:85-855(-)
MTSTFSACCRRCDDLSKQHSEYCNALANKFSFNGFRFVFNAPLTLWLGAICTIHFAIKYKFNIKPEYDLFRSPVRWEIQQWNLLSLPRFVLHPLGHGSWKHLLGNMTTLLLVLPLLEEKYKIRWLISISMLNALVCALITIISSKSNVVLGASGLVFQSIILSAFSGRLSGPRDIPLTLVAVIIMYIIPELQEFGSDDGVSHLAHLIGGLAGALAGFAARGHALLGEHAQRGSYLDTGPPARVEMRGVRAPQFFRR